MMRCTTLPLPLNALYHHSTIASKKEAIRLRSQFETANRKFGHGFRSKSRVQILVIFYFLSLFLGLFVGGEWKCCSLFVTFLIHYTILSTEVRNLFNSATTILFVRLGPTL